MDLLGGECLAPLGLDYDPGLGVDVVLVHGCGLDHVVAPEPVDGAEVVGSLGHDAR